MDESEYRLRETEELKSLFMDNLKYSTRRYDVVSLIFNGFGLYANYELYKPVGVFNIGSGFLLSSTLLLLILAFVNLYVLRCESILQIKWVLLYQNMPFKIPEEREKQQRKANKFEKNQERKRAVVFMGLVVTTVLTLVGFVFLNLG
jgi:Ca2+/Na+ antiporter